MLKSQRTHVLLPFLFTLSLIACCIEVDISVPGFLDMARDFGVSEAAIQMTIAYNFLGFCIGAFFHGPLSDAYGRRRIMILGNGLLLMGAMGCVFAPTIPLLWSARFVQGVGASTSAVVVFAMIADVYEGEKSVRLIGFMNAALTTLMALAPVAGGFINQAVGWRGNYGIVALVCLLSWSALVLRLPETKKNRATFCFQKIFFDYQKLFSDLKFFSASLAPSLLYGAYLSFVTCGAFLYQETFELSMMAYALHQACIVGVFASMSLLSGRVTHLLGNRKCIFYGMSACLLGTFLLFILGFAAPTSPHLTTFSMSFFSIGFAITYPVIFSDSLEIFPEIKGTTSSAIMGVRALLCASFVGLAGYLYTGKLLNVAYVLVLAMVICVASVTVYIRSTY